MDYSSRSPSTLHQRHVPSEITIRNLPLPLKTYAGSAFWAALRDCALTKAIVSVLIVRK